MKKTIKNSKLNFQANGEKILSKNSIIGIGLSVSGILSCFFGIILYLCYINNPYNKIILVDAGSSSTRISLFNYYNDKVDNFPKKEGQKKCNKIYGGNLKQYTVFKNTFYYCFKDMIKSFKINVYTTPILVRGTNGIRILCDIDKIYCTNYKLFMSMMLTELGFVVSDNTVYAMSGSLEAIYGWLAVNSQIYEKNNKTKIYPGTIDMGGASVEVAYPNKDLKNFKQLNGTNLNQLIGNEVDNCGGINNIRTQYEFMFVENSKIDTSRSSITIQDPCLGKTYKTSSNLFNYKNKCTAQFYNKLPKSVTNYTFVGTGNMNECIDKLKLYFGSGVSCDQNFKCIKNDLHVPPSSSNIEYYVGIGALYYMWLDFGKPEFFLDDLSKSISLNCLTTTSGNSNNGGNVKYCFGYFYVYHLFNNIISMKSSKLKIMDSDFGEFSWSNGLAYSIKYIEKTKFKKRIFDFSVFIIVLMSSVMMMIVGAILIIFVHV